MLKSTERIINSGLESHLIRDVDLMSVFKGSAASRYALINKSLKAKNLIRIARGLYLLAPKYNQTIFSQYYIANQLVPFSFVSAESALSFHGWIPEKITQVTSISIFGRNKAFKTSVGEFVYLVPPIPKISILKGVSLQRIHDKRVWMASPLRALMDYVYWHKVDNADISFLMNSLRIDIENIQTLQIKEIEELMLIYRAKRIRVFLKNIKRELERGK